MECKTIATTLQDGLKEFLGNKKAIIGISGGIDSAVVATLCVNIVGKENVIGIQMPYGNQSTKDGSELLKCLGLPDRTINIQYIVDCFESRLYESLQMDLSKLTNGNTRARTRMTILYAIAGELNGIVIGTGNKTELMLGYFTKHGDGGCDIEPIGELYKTEVFELAKYLGVPDCIINKSPSAELWEGQTDEKEIGMSYADMDKILKRLDGWVTPEQMELLKAECGKSNVEIILSRISNSEHKRNMPETIKIG